MVEATREYIDSQKGFEFLWKEKLEESFRAFLETGTDPRAIKHVITNADDEEEEDLTFAWMAERILDGVETLKPSLEVFDQKLTYLYRIKNEINEMKHSVDISWLKVNSSPLIKELQEIIKHWIEAYQNFLLNNTVREIDNINNFVEGVREGIKVLPEESKIHLQEQKDLLMSVMTHLRDVKMIQERTINEIEPLKQTVLLLKKYVKIPDYLVVLENTKTALIEVSEKALGFVKENILNMQKQEATALKQRQKDFDKRVFEYRNDFMKNCPYNITMGGADTIAKAYEKIKEYYIKNQEFEKEANELNNLETLFDIEPNKYKALTDCTKELGQLKYLWDLIALVDYQFASWSTTLWA